jgi:8-oxo-dGTP diphosphatase
MNQHVETVVRAIITDSHHHILLVKRKKPPQINRWSLPGGKVDAHEIPTQAITREIKEELNLSFFPASSFTQTDTQSIPGVHCQVTYFHGTVTGNIKIKTDEIVAIKHFTPQEIQQSQAIAFDHQHILQKVFEKS